MTRKQAVSRAIEELSKNQKNQEVCEVLKELHDELPLSHWTEKSIHDVVKQFVLENGRLPTAQDFLKVDYLPSRCTIKNKLGITFEEFYKKYYTDFYRNNRSRYAYKEIEFWIGVFKEQYIKHGEPAINKFDLVRDKNTPCAQTYLKITGIESWNELLDYCGFEIKGENIYSKINVPKKKIMFSVDVNFNEQVSAEQILEVNNKLETIISNKL